MKVHTTTMKTGISKTQEFAKKGLAQFAVNVGTKCGHACTYCSSGAMLRMHPSFKENGESPFANGYAIVDPTTPERVARDAERIRQRGLIQLCTTVDAYSPEAQEHGLGRKCLEAILSQPDWTVRVLTKSAAVVKDFDLIEKYRERVLVGLSLTAPLSNATIMSSIEPHASKISDRMAAMEEAHRRGLRTYGMLCPLLPGIADGPKPVEELVNFVLDCGAEEVFVEPVNSRGPALGATDTVLRAAGYIIEADALNAIRRGTQWSAYTRRLLENVQAALAQRHALAKLRFLLYPSRLTAADEQWIRQHGTGVRWLGK
jgi:DNA repair photolyase